MGGGVQLMGGASNPGPARIKAVVGDEVLAEIGKVLGIKAPQVHVGEPAAVAAADGGPDVTGNVRGGEAYRAAMKKRWRLLRLAVNGAVAAAWQAEGADRTKLAMPMAHTVTGSLDRLCKALKEVASVLGEMRPEAGCERAGGFLEHALLNQRVRLGLEVLPLTVEGLIDRFEIGMLLQAVQGAKDLATEGRFALQSVGSPRGTRGHPSFDAAVSHLLAWEGEELLEVALTVSRNRDGGSARGTMIDVLKLLEASLPSGFWPPGAETAINGVRRLRRKVGCRDRGKRVV